MKITLSGPEHSCMSQIIFISHRITTPRSLLRTVFSIYFSH